MKIFEESRSERRTSHAGRCLAVLCGAWLVTAAAADGPGDWSNPEPDPPAWINGFSGIWNDEAPATILVVSDDLSGLHSAMVAHHAEGRRLDAFESWRSDGVKHYAGLFRNGAEARWLVTNLDSPTFASYRQQQYQLGRRLIDVEVQLVGGEQRFAGLWASGSGAELYVEEEASDFEAKWQVLAATHHLVVFDTWWSEALGEVRAFGVYRGGAEPVGAELVVGRSWESFNGLVQGLGMRGRRLIDFDAAVSAFDDYFSGRWVVAEPVRDWLGVFYDEAFLRTSDLLFKSGHEFSAAETSKLFILPPPTASRMDLLDLEVTGRATDGGRVIVHGMPLHDAGTPGPPRPPNGGG